MWRSRTIFAVTSTIEVTTVTHKIVTPFVTSEIRLIRRLRLQLTQALQERHANVIHVVEESVNVGDETEQCVGIEFTWNFQER